MFKSGHVCFTGAPPRADGRHANRVMRFTWQLVGIATTIAAPASEGAFRCRDRDPLCDEWKGRGECERNYEFMAEKCPSACGYCEAAGFLPTPSPFQLDFVCNGQLSIAPKQITGQHDERMPDGCGFACRDNMTTCAAMQDLCTKHPETMRFQCPETCGVCKGIGIVGGGYPKHVCRLETGDAPENAEHCGGWASSGEVRRASLESRQAHAHGRELPVRGLPCSASHESPCATFRSQCANNFGFMRMNCEKSCGLCISAADGGATPKTFMTTLKPPRATEGKKSKKSKGKRKASSSRGKGGPGADDGVASAGETASSGYVKVSQAEAAAGPAKASPYRDEPSLAKVESAPAKSDAPAANAKVESALARSDAPAANAKVEPAAAKSDAPAAKEAAPIKEAKPEAGAQKASDDAAGKKKSWVSKAKEAVSSVLKGKKKDAPKDEM